MNLFAVEKLLERIRQEKRHQLSLSEAIAHLLQRLPDPNQLLPLSFWIQS